MEGRDGEVRAPHPLNALNAGKSRMETTVGGSKQRTWERSQRLAASCLRSMDQGERLRVKLSLHVHSLQDVLNYVD